MATHWLIDELAAARLADRMSRAKVSKEIGRTEASIASWERGTYEPTLSKLEEWAGVHGLRLTLVAADASSASERLLIVSRTRAMCASGEARRIREAAGVSTKEVAKTLGVSHSSVRHWENGEHVPHGHAALPYGRLLVALRRQQASS